MSRPSKLAIVSSFAALYLVWGSTYLAILFAIETIPPLLMAGARFLLAGMMLYSVARWRGAPKASRAHWLTALIIGGCLLLGGNGGVTLAEQYVPSGLASVMVATVPIYMALLGWLSGIAPRPTPIVWLGLIGGFIGVGILIGPALTTGSESSSNHLAIGMCILLAGSLIWSVGSLYSRTAVSSPSL